MKNKGHHGPDYKLLVVSDEETLIKYPEEKVKTMFKDVDLIISCGDLSNHYLDYLVTTLNKPLVYVNGNHVYGPDHDISFCTNVDGGGIAKVKGLMIVGFDGSRIYTGGEHQYTEAQMKVQVWRACSKLLLRKPDIVVSHAPVAGFHEGKHEVHRGFQCFKRALDFLRPKLWLHGHIHLKDHHQVQESVYRDTRIINAFGYKVVHLKKER